LGFGLAFLFRSRTRKKRKEKRREEKRREEKRRTKEEGWLACFEQLLYVLFCDDDGRKE